MSESSAAIECLGFIMDGNRRWAKARNLHTLEGHRKGAEVFIETVRFIRDQHIPHAIFYAFSSENWRRSEEEVHYLLELFSEKITELHRKFHNESDTEQRVRFRFIGELERFSQKLQEKMRTIEADSETYTDTTIWIALSYGGRAELVHAINQAVEAGEPVTEEAVSSLLWTKDMPDPDAIIRTGGQQRLSNYLPWQSVYSELIFLPQYWPDIDEAALRGILSEYQNRKRNFGA